MSETKFKLTSILVLFCMTACTDTDRSKKVLLDQGYTNIKFTGHDFLACGDRDQYSTGFIASSPAGHPVTGAVCCGVFKSCTIRLD